MPTLITHEISALLGLQHLCRPPRLIDYEVSGDTTTVVYARVYERPARLIRPPCPCAQESRPSCATSYRRSRSCTARACSTTTCAPGTSCWDGERARLDQGFADASGIDFDGDLASVLWLVHALSTGTREPTGQAKSDLPPREAIDPRFHALYDQVASGTRLATQLGH